MILYHTLVTLIGRSCAGSAVDLCSFGIAVNKVVNRISFTSPCTNPHRNYTITEANASIFKSSLINEISKPKTPTAD
jgi:hypothetical protein